MSRGRKLAAGLALAAALLVGAAVAQAQLPAVEAPAAPKLDAKAAAALKRLSDGFAQAKSLSVELTLAVKMQAEAMKQEMNTSYSVAMQRPNKLAFILKEGQGATLVSDGKKVYVYLSFLNAYVTQDAPADFDAIFKDSEFGGQGQKVLLVDSLLRKDPYQAILGGVTEGKYVGLEDVNGVKCDHLKFFEAQLDWDVWVAAEGTPLITKVVPDMSKALRMGGEGMPKGLKLDVLVTYSNWQVNLNLSDDRFSFTPPAGAKKVEDFSQAMSGMAAPGGAAAPGAEAKHPLVGKPAPDVALNLLGGGTMSLAAHKGKEVVILDFWATWCGPCRKSMPVVAEVAAEYQAKGVVLYAVNEEEKPEQASEFIKQIGVTSKVALDAEGKAGKLHLVEAMPHTVIIGKDGTVQAVHIGTSDSLKADLKKELDALLAGNKLVEDDK